MQSVGVIWTLLTPVTLELLGEFDLVQWSILMSLCNDFVSDLDARAVKLITDGLTSNSRRVYSQAVSKFINFCLIYLFNPLEINETLLLRFIS